jgi:hypothetical protein
VELDASLGASRSGCVSGPERPVTIEAQVGQDLLDHRLLEPIGNIPPVEAEARFYAMLGEQKRAA